ncbi:GntR family transcriptional regulator [Pantoea rodasii]|uniref:GntR family transcriptional regulator n=1 Tax=Pantoea rodasii TaxID=1076549 RepID=A0A2M9WGC2_9GAMM|nr:PLP-dependent aminotransferase family protein [Pantoea rodasii]ORM63143.1 GntR family transcriptional regulator [Pantoea rodasii]PJZ06612.1 GntR family transcriptional regulator [Pantoea rodasii]
MNNTFLALFDHHNTGGLRERLCTTLRQAIAQGHLSHHQRLPSSRQLARDLSLSRVTVEAAYAQLESEGYLLRQAGRGTFVSIAMPQRTQPSVTHDTPHFSDRGERVLATGGCQDPPFPHAFAAGSPELRAFPHTQWRRISNSVQRRLGSQVMGYGDPLGYWPLRQAVADYLALSRGVRCRAEQVVMLTSSQQALQLLALMFLDSGDEVWLEEPGYPGARNAFLAAGAHCRAMPLDSEGAVPLSGRAKLVYLTPAHHYPTGTPMSLPRRLRWLAWARQHQSWLIEDDYDSEFHYEERPAPALQGLENDSRVICLGTFSKTLFPSLRLAWMVVPEQLVDALGRARSVMDGHSALLPQAITAEFLQQGHFASHLRLMRQLYHSRRDRLLEQITSRMQPWLTPLHAAGGLQLTVQLRQGDEARLTQLAADAGLLLPRLSPLYAGSPPQSGWMLGFAALTPGEIISACDKLVTLLTRHAQTSR